MPDARERGATQAPIRSATYSSRGRSDLPNLQRYGLGNIRPLKCATAGQIRRVQLRALRVALKWQRHNNRPLGDGRNNFGESVSRLIQTDFLLESSISSLGRPACREFWETSPPQAPRSSKSLGEEHVKTSKPIVYTSGDSVFQIATHEEVVPLQPGFTRSAKSARRMLDGRHKVGRVIARPFLGEPGSFYRTENRHDYAVPPPRENLAGGFGR